MRSCKITSLKYLKYIIKYKVFDEKEYTQTDAFASGDLNHKVALHTRVISFSSVTKVTFNYHLIKLHFYKIFYFFFQGTFEIFQ